MSALLNADAHMLLCGPSAAVPRTPPPLTHYCYAHSRTLPRLDITALSSGGHTHDENDPHGAVIWLDHSASRAHCDQRAGMGVHIHLHCCDKSEVHCSQHSPPSPLSAPQSPGGGTPHRDNSVAITIPQHSVTSAGLCTVHIITITEHLDTSPLLLV